MEKWKKKYIDKEYILMRDEVIRYLLDYDKWYTLNDAKKIRNLLKTLIKVLKRGKDD